MNRQEKRQIVGPARTLDRKFLFLCFWATLVGSLGGGFVGAAVVGWRWGTHYVIVAIWMALNALILARLLLAATSKPSRPFVIWNLAGLKFFWLGLIVWYCWRFEAWRHPTAVAAGVVTLFVVFMVRFLRWVRASSRANRKDHLDTTETAR